MSEAPTDAGVVPQWWPVHALNPDRVLPRGVFGDHGPDGEPIATPTDHRMLWHVRNELLGAAATTPYLRNLFQFLNDYLAATCQHHWRDYSVRTVRRKSLHPASCECPDCEWGPSDNPTICTCEDDPGTCPRCN